MEIWGHYISLIQPGRGLPAFASIWYPIRWTNLHMENYIYIHKSVFMKIVISKSSYLLHSSEHISIVYPLCIYIQGCTVARQTRKPPRTQRHLEYSLYQQHSFHYTAELLTKSTCQELWLASSVRPKATVTLVDYRPVPEDPAILGQCKVPTAVYQVAICHVKHARSDLAW